MFNSQARPGDEEFGSLYNEEDHLRIEPKVPPRRQPSERADRTTLYFAILFIVLMGVAFFRAGQTPHRKIASEAPTGSSAAGTVVEGAAGEERTPTMGTEEHARTPKILWVLTAVELEGLRMVEGLVAKHLIHVGRRSGFDVRVVNAITAYDWLSPAMTERVRFAKHKSKYILQVHELLRLALLIEHGGLSVRLPRYIFPDDLGWLYDLLEQPLETLIRTQEQQKVEYCRSEKEAEVVLFYERGRGGERVYEDAVIYARKEAKLLQETFTEMSELAVSGNWPYQYLVDIEQIDADVRVKYVKNMFTELINFKQFYWFTGSTFCTNYQVLSIDKNAGLFLLKINNEDSLRSELMADKEAFFERHGRRRMIQADLRGLNYNFEQVLSHEMLSIAHKNSIFRTDIIEIKGNEWMTQPVNKTRDVRYCVISLKPLPFSYQPLLGQSVARLQTQSYPHWHAVYFVQGLSSDVNYSASVKLFNTSASEGLNLLRAATRHCQRGEVGLLLDYDESLGYQHDLRNIEVEMRNRSIYGAFLSVKLKGDIYKARFARQAIRRKAMEPNLPLLQEVAHNFRVFSIEAYMHIPHMSLHDNSGRYYAREVAFLTLLEMAWDYRRCNGGGMLYHTKRVEQVMEIPKDRTVLPNTFIVMNAFHDIDITQYEYISKYAARSLCSGMDTYLDRKGRDMRHFFILNNGTEFVGYQDRKHYPQLTEKKIHQMWVGGEIPKFKKFLTNKIKQNHPDYEYYFWTNDNITRENFPVSYDIINTLMEFSKVSRYNKMSMVSDLMRAEIIYNHGGIYLDTNYLVFGKNALDDWLTFKGMFISQLYPYHRFQREGTVFSAMKGFHRVKRLVDHRAISTRNHYSKQAHIEAGPTFFTATVLGEEELDPDILQPSFEHLYPYYPWEDSNHPNRCQTNMDAKEDQLLFKNKRAYKKNCADLYPWAIGMDFWNEGKTWA